MRVRIPNLAKYRDEYSRKSGHTPETVRTKSSPDTDTDTDTERRVARSVRKPTGASLTDEEWLQSLRSNPAYSHIDLDVELGKMDAWISLHPSRRKTRRFILNWLSKIERPLARNGAAPSGKPLTVAGRRLAQLAELEAREAKS